MVTANLLLSVFFLSGALAACPKESDLFITTPQNMEALTGSCLQIPCNFSATHGKLSDNGTKITGVWIKNHRFFQGRPENVIFNGSKTVNEYPMNITDAPKDTSASISPSGLVSAGSWVNLTCSSRANPPVSRFTWFKKSTGGDLSVSEGAFYTFNVTDKGVYYCVATNDVGNQTSPEIHLSVEGESLPWGPVLGGIVGIIVLVCLIVCVCWLKSTRPTDMVYAQVKVSKKADRSTETADGLEDLYAQVKKK
ncbi:B-cell receptor CD22-like [Seriola lalandi dorsalis]|uniref:B-cell receptor CD22-like n=1 Tax=Seriola lalandi dorsalis TaxID=1841481 RepID=UPI000C6FB6EF|nr:B-cell receptor CD22-like [Seriola lalandi dorsalis]